MPQFARSLDVYQGFNFKKDKQTPTGFITELTIGTDGKLNADQETMVDPTKPKEHIKAVGVLGHYLWETGITDAMYMSAQISVHNKQILMSKLLLGAWTDMSIKFKYVLFEYDPVHKKYFVSNSHDKELNGILEKNGDEINLVVSDDPSHEVQSPLNFTLQIGIKPATKEQQVTLATGEGKKVVKQWGVTEKAG